MRNIGDWINIRGGRRREGRFRSIREGRNLREGSILRKVKNLEGLMKEKV